MDSFEHELRRAAWRQNLKIFAVGAVVLALGVGFLFVYGDPWGRTESGHLDVSLIWRNDGTLGATVRTPFASQEDNQRVADAIVPALLGADTPVSVSIVQDKGGPHFIEAQTRDAVASSDNPLELSTADLVNAAQQVGLTSVDLSVEVPNVHAQLVSSAPATRYSNYFAWQDIQDLQPLTVTVSLRPSVRSWVIQTAALTVTALLVLGLAVVTGRRVLHGGLPERRARLLYGIGMVLSAVGFIWSLRLEGTVDDPYLVWHLDGLGSLAAQWATAVLWLFVGGWITFALLAGAARDRVRMSYPPPPTPTLPSP